MTLIRSCYFVILTLLVLNAYSSLADRMNEGGTGMQGGMGSGNSGSGMQPPGSLVSPNVNYLDTATPLDASMMSAMPQSLDQGISFDELLRTENRCPLNEGSADIAALFDDTIETLKQFNETKAENCSFLTSQSGTLAKKIADLKKVENDFQMAMQLPDCSNYEFHYKSKYEAYLNRFASGVSVMGIDMEFENACFTMKGLFAMPPYSEESIKYIEGEYVSKLKDKEKACENFNKDNKAIDIHNAKLDSIQSVSTTINGMIENIDSCNSSDISNGIVRQLLSVATTISSSAIGGMEALGVSFLGGISDSIAKMYKRNTVNELVAEKNFRNLACLFYNVQKKRCSLDEKSTMFLNPILCNDDPIPNEHLNQPNLAALAENVDMAMKSARADKHIAVLTSKSFDGHDINGYIDNVIIPLFKGNRDVISFRKVKEYKAAVNGYLAANNALTNEEFKAKPNKERIQKLSVLFNASLEQLKELSLFDIMQTYMESLVSSDDGLRLKMIQDKVHEQTQFLIKEKLTIEAAVNNRKDLNMITDSLVYDLRETFEDHLEKSYNNSVRNAKNLQKRSKKPNIAAFQEIAYPIKECLMTSGMYLMKQDSGGEDASSTTMIEDKSDISKVFKKACMQFYCKDGLPSPAPYLGNIHSYNEYQCSVKNHVNQLMRGVQERFLETGKICGKKISQLKEL